MYVAIFLLAVGYYFAAPSLWRAIVALALIVLLDAKARYEDVLLRESYPEYHAYLAATKRFIPLVY